MLSIISQKKSSSLRNKVFLMIYRNLLCICWWGTSFEEVFPVSEVSEFGFKPE